MTRLFLITTSVFVALLICAAILTRVALQAEDVEQAQAGYEFYAYWVWRIGPLTALFLWVLANIVVFQEDAKWPIWLTFGYWCFGVFIRYSWMDNEYLRFMIDRLKYNYDALISSEIVAVIFLIVPVLMLMLINHVAVSMALTRKARADST